MSRLTPSSPGAKYRSTSALPVTIEVLFADLHTDDVHAVRQSTCLRGREIEGERRRRGGGREKERVRERERAHL